MSELDEYGLLDHWAYTRINFPIEQSWHLNITAGNLDLLAAKDFKQYRISAAEQCAEHLGSKPVLAISGGVDSQAMLQCFMEAGIDIDIAHLKFKDDLNSHDTDTAVKVAEKYNKQLITIELDVVKFLHHQLWNYAEKYESSSPQFACHHWFYEQLINQGYTGIAMGGDSWTPLDSGGWHWSGMDLTLLSWSRFAKKNSLPMVGNFLSSYWPLCISLGCCYTAYSDIYQDLTSGPDSGELHRINRSNRYQYKLAAFKRYGFDVTAQQDKSNGFERVKEIFNQPLNDPWAFERQFRWPLQKRWPTVETVKLELTDSFSLRLAELYSSYGSLRQD